MNKFKLISKFKPTGDQPEAIKQLTEGIKSGKKFQTLLGVTGSGKTYTMAKVIENVQKPTLVISHNKTLAAQLCSEFRGFFPENAVGYFVSYYDYYQPEAYIPSSDTYIEKETSLNEEIEKLRQQTTANLLSRKDVIIVASVSCIYGLGSPEDYERISTLLKLKEKHILTEALKKLTALQYQRNDTEFKRGVFRVKGDTLDIFPSYLDEAIRIEFFGNEIEKISVIDPLTSAKIEKLPEIRIFPAKHFVAPEERIKLAMHNIREELKIRVKELKKQGKDLEAQRLSQRTNFDLEMLQETGYCPGIENYSRHFSGRKPGEPPFTLVDYFLHPVRNRPAEGMAIPIPSTGATGQATTSGRSVSNRVNNTKDFLLIIDESHITVPQIGGMYFGDRSRKQTLVDFGFRLPSALDNRPLKFEEFEGKINQAVFTSATPSEYELKNSTGNKINSYTELYKSHKKGLEVSGVTEQVIRPTGILDPEIEIKPARNQIDDAISEIQNRVKRGQRTLVTTLTKRMAEDLSEYLTELNIKVNYLHSDVETLKRLDILKDLRSGVYDVVVGINLLREGLDLPEVSLVLILDADNEGFLRSNTSLIQTIGRAARHIEGKAVIYADKITGSIKQAVEETQRRRKIQEEHNKKHGITPQSIKKAIKETFAELKKAKPKKLTLSKIPKDEISRVLEKLEEEMNLYADALEFEKAAKVRDQIKALEQELEKTHLE